MDGISEPRPGSGVCSEETGADPGELVERIRRGDAGAFEILAREQAPRLFRLALRLTGKREEAEDLVQETLVRSLPALRRFEGRARLSTYLIRALGNLWKNSLRSRSRSRLVAWLRPGSRSDGDDEATFDPPDRSASPLEELEKKDRESRVRAAIVQLEPQRRWTLLLREVEELSYEEIAETTGVAIGTVRSRLARAREDLRRLLETSP